MFPRSRSILTHIESEPATIETGDELTAGEEMLPRLKAIAAAFPDVMDVHEVVVRKFNDRLYLSCHCTMADDLPLHKVHELSTALEIRFKQEIPELFKVSDPSRAEDGQSALIWRAFQRLRSITLIG